MVLWLQGVSPQPPRVLREPSVGRGLGAENANLWNQRPGFESQILDFLAE